MTKLYYCMIATDRLETMSSNVLQAIPYVDEVIVVDGGSTDGSREWLSEQPKVHVVDFPWCDDFAGSRNAYLRKIGELTSPGERPIYVRADDDEFMSPDLLKNLRVIADQAKEARYNQVLVRARDIFVDRLGETVSDTLAEFWKPLIHEWELGMTYFGKVHEALYTPSGAEQVQLDDRDGSLVYIHYKRDRVYWPRGLRNFIIGGGGVPPRGDKQPLWAEFKNLIRNHGEFKTYRDFEAYLKGGNIAQEIKDWFVANRRHGLPSYDPEFTEVREGFLTYFVWFHPEELPAELIELDRDYMDYREEIKKIHGECNV